MVTPCNRAGVTVIALEFILSNIFAASRAPIDEAVNLEKRTEMSHPLKASLLLFLFLVCGSALVVTHKLRERLPAPNPRELFAIVNQQLVAFRSSDFRGAYRHAATGVQQKFTLAQFEAMVRRDYPEMTRSQRVEFGLVRVQGGSAMVQVFLIRQDGAVRSFLYSLTNEEAVWKIDGVEELRSYRRDQLAGSRA